MLGSEQATGSERVSLVPASPASITDKVLNAGGQAEQGPSQGSMPDPPVLGPSSHSETCLPCPVGGGQNGFSS